MTKISYSGYRRFRSHCSQGLLRFAHAVDDLPATTRRRPGPGERQYPVLPLGDDRLVEKDFDPRRADRGALDRVSHIILGRRVRSQTASLSFTWGVLDRLLEEERIDIEGISATSAGAMNAAVLAYVFATGGRDGARAALATFWRRVSRAARTSPLQASWLDRAFGNHSLRFSPAFVLFDLATH